MLPNRYWPDSVRFVVDCALRAQTTYGGVVPREDRLEDVLAALKSVQTVVAALAGLVSGAIGSLVAPWIQWGIEKKRDTRMAQRQAIDDIRSMIDEHTKRDDEYGFLNEMSYMRLRPEMDPDVVKSLERPRTLHIRMDIPGAGPAPLRRLSNEVSRIEREWKLV